MNDAGRHICFLGERRDQRGDRNKPAGIGLCQGSSTSVFFPRREGNIICNVVKKTVYDCSRILEAAANVIIKIIIAALRTVYERVSFLQQSNSCCMQQYLKIKIR